jgi:glutamyl-Q tRNA(Asp) synthetase
MGRFAPSPTGPYILVHSLPPLPVIAMQSQSRHMVVRIEDTDIPRIYPDSESTFALFDAFNLNPMLRLFSKRSFRHL